MFAERQLQFTFSGAKSGSFSAAGLRAAADIQAYGGRLGVLAQVRIWGLSLAQMNSYSSTISAGVGIDQFNLVIEAGDFGAGLSQVINGAIWRSFIDLTDAPESAFTVSVAGTVYSGTTPIAPQSRSGAQNAESLIASLCAAAGLTLHNNGAHAVLRNHATSGSAVDQIADIARAAKFMIAFDGNAVYLWPRNGTRDSAGPVEVGPSTGMVGYPQWWEAGIIVTSLFNQQIRVGRQMKITSSIPKANGIWDVIQVQHDLTTMMDNGPWFTTAVLSTSAAA